MQVGAFFCAGISRLLAWQLRNYLQQYHFCRMV
jgi:hypothetical protein